MITSSWSAQETRVLGCVLAGAVGDALGASVEFLSIETIRQKYGERGITGIGLVSGDSEITDDTQMTLFTLEGLIRAHVRNRTLGTSDPIPVIQHAYQRWLHTQGVAWAGCLPTPIPALPDGWLITERQLFARRAPGRTCITALRGFAAGREVGSPTNRLNDSKGCGGVMRAAPAALWTDDPSEAFDLGVRIAALTHSHPSGYLFAGVFAFLVHQLLRDVPLAEAVSLAISLLKQWEGHEEQLAMLDTALRLAKHGQVTPEVLAAELGGGWVGEEALAIAVYAALAADTVSDALRLSVNHSGDSDSTGSICGNLLGAYHGIGAIPAEWLMQLELKDAMTGMVRDALLEFSPHPPTDAAWYERYPPH